MTDPSSPDHPGTEAGQGCDDADRLRGLADGFLTVFAERQCDPRALAPVTMLSIDDAYGVQDRVIASRVSSGEQVAGYKVGCTSKAIRRQFGLTEPISGRLMHPHVHWGDSTLDWGNFVDCAVEPEFVITIGKDLTDEVAEDSRLDRFIDSVSPGIEVHNFRFWSGPPSSQELIASNGIHACLVIGDAKTRPGSFDWCREGVGLRVNDHLAASGTGSEIMGGPMTSLRWLANHLVRRGHHLEAGQLVIPGSPVELVSVSLDDRVEARFAHIGSVQAEFRS